MLNLLLILVILFAVLAILLPLIEKFGPEPDPEKIAKMSRWIVPLMLLAIVLQGVKMLMN